MIHERVTERSLAQLESAGMLELAAVEPDLEYLFRHALIQEAAYESLLRQDRRRLHRSVAECMEEVYPDRLDELAGVVAMHFEAADERERAVGYFLRAGSFGLARFAGHEAKAAFDRAAALLDRKATDPETRRLRVEADLGATEAGLPFVPGAEQLAVLDRARADAEALGDDALLARVYLLIAAVRRGSDELYESSPELREAIDRGLELAERSGSPVNRAEPLALLGEAKLRAADHEAAVALLEEAISLAEGSGRTDLVALFGSTYALALGSIGRFAEALHWIERATELGRQIGDPTAILDADLARGMLEAMRGRPEAAIEFAARAAADADRLGNKACGYVARTVIGEQRLLLDQPEQAIQVLEEGADLAEFCNFAPFRVEYTLALLDTARARFRGDPRAPERLDAALELARANGDRPGEAEVLRQRGRERLRCSGVSDDALGDFAVATAIFRELGALPDVARTLVEHAAALDVAGRAEEAKALRAEAEAVRTSMETPFVNAAGSR